MPPKLRNEHRIRKGRASSLNAIQLVAGVTFVVYAALQAMQFSCFGSPSLPFTSESLVVSPLGRMSRPDGAVGNVRTIIDESYYATFRHLENCSAGEPIQDCMAAIRHNPDQLGLPWWFSNLLSDGSNNKTFPQGSPGDAFIVSDDPNITMCNIEKVGVTEWRKVFSVLNGINLDDLVWRPGKVTPKSLKKNHRPGQRKRPLSGQMPFEAGEAFVFFRDPLERFLSAYIDKCEHTTYQGHCQPFGFMGMELLDRFKQEDKKIKFDAYVDTMPLKWDMHFFPQSLYCDGVFRHLSRYDFVGSMGPDDFYRDIHASERLLGERFGRIVRRIFHVPNDWNNSVTVSHARHATGASEKVREYYTAASLKKVLKYVAIDYKMLGLPIPTWTEEMLLGHL